MYSLPDEHQNEFNELRKETKQMEAKHTKNVHALNSMDKDHPSYDAIKDGTQLHKEKLHSHKKKLLNGINQNEF